MPMQPKTEQEKRAFFLQLIIDFATANNNQQPTIQDIQEVLELEERWRCAMICTGFMRIGRSKSVRSL